MSMNKTDIVEFRDQVDKRLKEAGIHDFDLRLKLCGEIASYAIDYKYNDLEEGG